LNGRFNTSITHAYSIVIGGIQGDVLATDNNTVGMGDAGIKSAIQGSNVPNPDEAVPSFVSGAMAKAGKGLLEGTLQRSEERRVGKSVDLGARRETLTRADDLLLRRREQLTAALLAQCGNRHETK